MKPRIMGHRGAMGCEPENTLRAIRYALDLGVGAVEVDVHLSRDGRLVVIHDQRLERTTNGQGRVRDWTFAELRTLDAGKGEPILSLEEVAELVRGRAHLVVELKPPEAAPALLRFFQEHELFAHAHLISFWHPAIKALKEQEPRLPTGILLVGCPVDPVGLARAALANALFLQYAYVTSELVEKVHAQGLKIFAWNIDTVDDFKPYQDMDLDGIGSNRPDILIKYLRTGPGEAIG